MNFGVRDERFPSFVQFGAVNGSAFPKTDFIFATACSTNHVYSVVNELYSLLLAEKDASIVLIDIGISDSFLNYLLSELVEFNKLREKLHAKGLFYYRKFNFRSFPHWWNIEDRLVRGGYSWKIAAIYDVLIESQRVLVWTDTGNLLPPDINKDLNRTFLYGAYTPYSGDNINKWVHPLSRRFMALHKMVRKIMPGRGMCDGAYMLIDYNNATVMSDVIIPYVQCAYTRKCITPYGATRKNHRQDQAIITVLMHSAVIKESCNAAYNSQVLTHNDCKQLDKCDLVKQRVLNLINMVYF